MFARIHRWRGCFADDSFELSVLNLLEEIMTTQAEIDARADAVLADVANLNVAVEEIKTALAGVAAAAPADLDLSKLDAAVAGLDAVTASAAAVVPAPAAPTT